MADKQETGSVPTNIAMMIGEIKGTIQSEFASLAKELGSLRADLTKVRDDHEHRIGVLEQAQGERRQQIKVFEKMVEDVDGLMSWRATREGNVQGATWLANVGKMALGAGLAALGFFGWNTANAPKEVARSQVTVERVHPAPVPLK